MNASHRLAAFILSVPFLHAQGTVSPPHFARAEGNTYNYVGFGDLAAPCRILEVHGDLAGAPRTITSLALRRDGDTTSPYGAYSVIADVFLSTAATTPASPDATFAANHGANKTQVAALTRFQFPATTHGAVPRPFDYRLVLPRPYQHDGAGPLCWEAVIYTRQNTFHVNYDAVTGASTNPQAAVTTLGTGCKASDQASPATLTGSSSMYWPQGRGRVTYNGALAPKNTVAFMLIGFNNTTLAGIPLPLEIPTSSAGSSRACFIYNDFVFLLPGFTSPTGSFEVNVDFPAQPELNGGRVFGQGIAQDLQANALGIVSTPQVNHTIVAPFAAQPVGLVHAPGNVATGTVLRNAGYVVQFD